MNYLHDDTESDPWGSVAGGSERNNNNASFNNPLGAAPTSNLPSANEFSVKEDLTSRLFGNDSNGTSTPVSYQEELITDNNVPHEPLATSPLIINNDPLQEDFNIAPQQSVWESNKSFLPNDSNVDSNGTNNGADGEESINDTDLSDWIMEIRKTFNPLARDIITIEEIPEREGLLFKHTNYKVKRLFKLPNEESTVFANSYYNDHGNNENENIEDQSVIRRYSDFIWLQEILLKRYPFRLIPELPPKRIGSQNVDPVFISKRRRGLLRFINLVVKHPILSKDDLLLTFLTVPTDLSNWRKQTKNNYDTTDEFLDKKISPVFIKLWKKTISEQWNNVASSLNRTIDVWNKISIVIQRNERRLKQMNQEYSILNNALNEFTQLTPIFYPVENNETLPDINNNLSMMRTHLKAIEDINENQIKDDVNSLYPKLKRFIDILISLRNLFERYKIMATNNVPQLQRHVQLNMEKLESMKGKPDASGAEYDKLKISIKRDRKSIMEQLNRAWLIRECILHEFSLFQETQFLISDIFKEWTKINANYCGININEWEKLADQIIDMPISRP